MKTFNISMKIESANNIISSNGGLKGDNLVERVMESIKVLNKKEDEMKKQQKSSQNNKKLTTQKSNEVSSKPSVEKKFNEQADYYQTDKEELISTAQSMRKRINTLTVGERPNIFNNNTQQQQKNP